MSFFAAACATAFVSHDAVNGEPVRLVPKAATGGSTFVVRASDYAATPRDVIGIFNDDAVIDVVKGSGANTHENTDLLTRRTSVDFDRSLFDAVNSAPAEGWVLVATSQPRQPRYRVVTAEPDGVARLVCRVVFLDYAAP